MSTSATQPSPYWVSDSSFQVNPPATAQLLEDRIAVSEAQLKQTLELVQYLTDVINEEYK
jgi:hypothetical protein